MMRQKIKQKNKPRKRKQTIVQGASKRDISIRSALRAKRKNKIINWLLASSVIVLVTLLIVLK